MRKNRVFISCFVCASMLLCGVELYSDTKKDMNNLSSKDLKTRRTAAENLGKEAHVKEVEQTLISVLSSELDATTRAQLLESLAKSGTDEALNAILLSLEDPSDGVRKTAITLISRFGDRPEVVAPLEKVLNNPKEQEGIKLMVVDLLKGISTATELLEKTASSGNEAMHEAAVYSLQDSARRGNKDAQKRLKGIKPFNKKK